MKNKLKKDLTIFESFKAMIKFLEGYYERTKSDDIASLLSDTLYSEEGETADPAAWYDWIDAIKKVKKEKD